MKKEKKKVILFLENLSLPLLVNRNMRGGGVIVFKDQEITCIDLPFNGYTVCTCSLL